MQNKWYELSSKISQSKNVVISGHIKPDGDSVGACLAMAGAIKKSGKDVYVLMEQHQNALDIIPGKEMIKEPSDEIDLFISLDCADKERLGSAVEFFDRAKYTISIDHHVSNTMFADKNYVFDTASSTCEIIYDAIISDFMLDKDIASALYAGIIFDTGGLRHPSTTTNTFLIVSNLIAFNIPFTEILTELFYKHSYSQAKLLAKALDNVCIMPSKKITYTSLTLDEMCEVNSNPLETEGIIDYIKNINGTDIAVFLYQVAENEIKASFRSDTAYNVCNAAKKFGGGGHVNASGCTLLNMNMKEALASVLEEVEKLLESSNIS